jgi:hypothetical protein
MKFEIFFEVHDTCGGVFDEIPKIPAKTAKEAVSKYLKDRNANFKPEFARNGNGQIVVTKIGFFPEKNSFYKIGKTTTYNLINI